MYNSRPSSIRCYWRYELFLIFILSCLIIFNNTSCFTFPPRSFHFQSQFCIQLKSFYQLAGHDIISHFLYLMTSVTRILTTFQIMSSTILGDKSCENVYEEGITYFGEQVSTSLFNPFVWSTNGEKKFSLYWGVGGTPVGSFVWEGRASLGSHTHFTYWRVGATSRAQSKPKIGYNIGMSSTFHTFLAMSGF